MSMRQEGSRLSTVISVTLLTQT